MDDRFSKLHTIMTIDPLVNVDKRQSRIVSKGGVLKSVRLIPPNGASNSSVNWTTIFPPSYTTVVKREIVARYTPVVFSQTVTADGGEGTTYNGTLTRPALQFNSILGASAISGTATNGAEGQPYPSNGPIMTANQYVPNNDNYGVTAALRSFPLAESTNSLQLAINKQTTTLSSNDLACIYPYILNDEEKETWCSSFPCTPQTEAFIMPLYTSWSSGQNTRSQLSPRNGSSEIISHASLVAGQLTTIVTTGTSPDFISTKYDTFWWDVYEPIMISPLTYGEGSFAKGFANIGNLQVTLQLTNIGRMIEVSPVALLGTAAVPGTSSGPSTIVSVSLYINGLTAPANFTVPESGGVVRATEPTLYMQYITNNAFLEKGQPSLLYYPFETLQQYLTPGGFTSPLVTPGAITCTYPFTSSQVTLQSVQLPSVPARVFIYLRPSKDAFSGSNALLQYYYANNFARITKVQVNFNNRTTLLAEASERDLWQMSVRNGIKMSFYDWQNNGSVLCLDTTRDLCLPDQDIVGQANKYTTIQVTVTYTTQNLATALAQMNQYWQSTDGIGAVPATVPYSAYLVLSLVGEAVISDASCDFLLVGPSSEQVVDLTAAKALHVNENAIMPALEASGGDMSFFSKVPRFLSQGLDTLAHISPSQVDSALKAVGAVNDAVKSFGGATVGGATVGGATGGRARIY